MAKRINWQSETVVDALTMVALGISYKKIRAVTGLSPGQVMYRADRQGSMRLGDFRMMRSGTVGGDAAKMMIDGLVKQTVRRSIKVSMPYKRQTADGMPVIHA